MTTYAFTHLKISLSREVLREVAEHQKLIKSIIEKQIRLACHNKIGSSLENAVKKKRTDGKQKKNKREAKKNCVGSKRNIANHIRNASERLHQIISSANWHGA